MLEGAFGWVLLSSYKVFKVQIPSQDHTVVERRGKFKLSALTLCFCEVSGRDSL